MNEDEKRRMKYFINQIKFHMLSVSEEVDNREKPHRPYLLEKLYRIKSDVECLISIIEEV